MIKLYNTLSREKEEFKPIKKGEVKIYTCGPTVYWFAHAGNFRAYVFADVLKRVLMYNGFKVKHIINITDVGHLTSDADSGEDKIEKTAMAEGKTASEISHFYADAFKKDFRKLNLIEPFKWVWATKHIKEQIEMIVKLEEKGFTYKTSDGVYFDTSKFKDYGKLSHKNIEGLEAGKRVSLGEKKNITDFALWKFSGEVGKRQQEWDSPWGVGFPGWHIECSAMATKYLGTHFDIHTGGEDHIPVHHENEIAQSECSIGDGKWVNYWMHVAFLNIRGGKMSKSSGSVKTISDLEVDGVSPMAYRYFTFTAHYRKPLTWSDEAIASAVSSYRKMKNIVGDIEDDGGLNEEYLVKFRERINDDLDMPGAIAVLWKLLRDDVKGKVGAVKKMDEVLGLRLFEKVKKDISNVKILIDKRIKAKKKKDWDESDRLRDEIIGAGYTLEDNKEGFAVSGTQISV